MNEKLSTDDALDIVYSSPVASQELSQHRWYTRRLVVFEHDGHLRGFIYLDPATEEQEAQDRFEDDPVPTFSVRAREVTTTIYEREQEGGAA